MPTRKRILGLVRFRLKRDKVGNKVCLVNFIGVDMNSSMINRRVIRIKLNSGHCHLIPISGNYYEEVSKFCFLFSIL